MLTPARLHQTYSRQSRLPACMHYAAIYKELSAIEVALFSESTEFSVFSLKSGSGMLLLTQTMLVVVALTCEASMIIKGNKRLFTSTLTCQSVRSVSRKLQRKDETYGNQCTLCQLDVFRPCRMRVSTLLTRV